MLMPALNRRRIMDVVKIIIAVAKGIAWVAGEISSGMVKSGIPSQGAA